MRRDAAAENGEDRVLGLEAAEAWVRSRIGGSGGPGGRPVIGVTGPVASGKSTLAKRLAADGGVHLTTDRYLPDYARVTPGTEDDPEQSDLARLAEDLAVLARGDARAVPVWSFHTHRREGEETVGPASDGSLVVVEGLHALFAGHLGLLDLAVLVDARPETRLERWLEISRRGERGWGEEKTRSFFHETAEPTFERFRAGYSAAASVLVWNDEA